VQQKLPLAAAVTAAAVITVVSTAADPSSNCSSSSKAHSSHTATLLRLRLGHALETFEYSKDQDE
jgi:hypothetical protein